MSNRIIKFRGKTISFTEKEPDGSDYVHEGKWLYGFYHKDHDGVHWIIEDCKSGRIYPGWEVEPDTVGQFTGLKAQGKELYDGDIYLHNGRNFVMIWSDNVGVCSVELNRHYEKGMTVIKNDNNRRDFIDIINIEKYIKIIGNIHENPELLR